MREAFSGRRLSETALVFLVLLGTGIVVDNAVISTPSAPVAAQPAPPPVRNEPVKVPSGQHVENAFGPFKAIAVSRSTPTPDTHAPAILLLGVDGSTRASEQWTIPFDPTQWDQQGSFQIAGVDPSLGYVTIQTSSGRIFVVKAGQVFLIAGSPEYAFAVDANGEIFTITTPRAEGMRVPLTN